MTAEKPVLMGMNNPYTDDPKFALHYTPKRSAGHRLSVMFLEAAKRAGRDLTEEDYAVGFDRRNLLNKTVWHPTQVPHRRILESFQDRVVVLCGARVAYVLGLPHLGFHLNPTIADRFVYYTIPHPSGLTREYNDPEMRTRVGDLLYMLYKLGRNL
jgi:hypothetical protein